MRLIAFLGFIGIFVGGGLSYNVYGDPAWVILHAVLGWGFVVWYGLCG